MPDDRSLLQAAAMAAGYVLHWTHDDLPPVVTGGADRDDTFYWNPLTDDGDAQRLAVKLAMTIGIDHARGRTSVTAPGLPSDWNPCVDCFRDSDPYAATRRAIVRAAAALAEAKEG